METYDSIIALINKNSNIVDFAEFGNGVSELWIEKAEVRLSVAFPPSYVWWLKNYGGGEILGEEIFSVYEQDFDKVIGGDIVYMNELDRKNQLSNSTQLIIQVTDRSEIFYFDLLQRSEDGECPVYLMFVNYKDKYANNFLEFLAKRIKD